MVEDKVGVVGIAFVGDHGVDPMVESWVEGRRGTTEKQSSTAS